MKTSNFDKYPHIKVVAPEDSVKRGWKSISEQIKYDFNSNGRNKYVVAVETYQGVDDNEVYQQLKDHLQPEFAYHSLDYFQPPEKIEKLVAEDVTDDAIFGKLSQLKINDFFNQQLKQTITEQIDTLPSGLILIYGPGASLLSDQTDNFVYADMARWELQQRMRSQQVSNLGVNNSQISPSLLYKQSYFVDWRVLDQHKVSTFEKWNYYLDTHKANDPRMVACEYLFQGLKNAAQQPFRVVPFFDPGPWGGQWMKSVCDLDPSKKNYAWCFDCVPEENSLLLEINGCIIETPAVNLVFYQAKELLGEHVYKEFGAEFPIRFDFLDTMQGGNLSLQVHPLKEYIQEQNGMSYTQDESYYLMDADENAEVYLGLREDINPEVMLSELNAAQQGQTAFDAKKHVQTWPVKKHDHVLIPAGTVHCSGKGSMVLEISSTPYIFTYKLWDWGRMGMDGKPRPINIEHGKNVIQWNRTTNWVKDNLVNNIQPINEGQGWKEERTGLHETEFIETRRHWFTEKVTHNTEGNLNVLNLVEGREAIVESPTNAFKPFIVHYAETFILPAQVGAYSIRPHGDSQGKECATIKAYVRSTQ